MMIRLYFGSDLRHFNTVATEMRCAIANARKDNACPLTIRDFINYRMVVEVTKGNFSHPLASFVEKKEMFKLPLARSYASPTDGTRSQSLSAV